MSDSNVKSCPACGNTYFHPIDRPATLDESPSAELCRSCNAVVENAEEIKARIATQEKKPPKLARVPLAVIPIPSCDGVRYAIDRHETGTRRWVVLFVLLPDGTVYAKFMIDCEALPKVIEALRIAGRIATPDQFEGMPF